MVSPGYCKTMELYLVCEHQRIRDNLDSDFKVRQYLTKELAKAPYLVSLSSVRLRASV